MRAPANLVLALILAAPATSIAQTCESVDCAPMQTPTGPKEQAIYYYHIEASSPVLTERHEYFKGLVLLLPAGQSCDRLVHEVRVPVLLASCQKGHKTFETSLGVTIGGSIGGELHQLVAASDPSQVVGTVFIDDPSAGVEAKGGVVGTQKYYDCTDPGGPHALLQNFSLFSPGFDTRAIDGATAATIRKFWTGAIQAQIDVAARAHVVNDATRSCVEISFEAYGTLLKKPGVSCSIEYDSGDPGAVAIGIPPS